MRTPRSASVFLIGLLMAILTLSLAGCGTSGGGGSTDTDAPQVTSTTPAGGASATRTNGQVTATFDEEMDAATLTSANFTVTDAGAAEVAGTVSHYDGGKTIVFTPASALAVSTLYTARLSTGVEDASGNGLAASYSWTFTTDAVAAVGVPVYLGSAASFVILAKTGISTTGTTAVDGDIGVSPAAQSYITGFSESLDAGNEFATSVLVTGRIYAADMAPPTPTMMTAAIGDMETAYIEAAGRILPDDTNLGGGNIGGLTLAPGLYSWGSDVVANTNVTLNGGANDVWILQISNDLILGSGVEVVLTGGAQPQNIFWQVAGQVTVGTDATLNGVVLSKTQIALNTNAALNGRAFAQTAVTLDANAVTAP